MLQFCAQKEESVDRFSSRHIRPQVEHLRPGKAKSTMLISCSFVLVRSSVQIELGAQALRLKHLAECYEAPQRTCKLEASFA